MSGLLRILEGRSLQEKLIPPSAEDLDLIRKGPLPVLPGRPVELAPRVERPPPFREFLVRDDPQSHGRILHHFANHELQAIELAAAALLRHQSAPSGYRLELLQLLIDEQKHLHFYLQRMQELGVTFGELPLSFHFWNSLHNTPDYRSFICGMNLTFEQANLDFAVEYRWLFHKRHDHASARILSRILHDEIRHVSHGLRHLDADTREQWTLYRKNLSPQLSPIRGKGSLFSKAARRRAGFGEEYINTIFLFSDSRGRRSTVYYFNPPAQGKLHQILSSDFGMLMSLLAAPDDVVLYPGVRPEFLLESRKLGLHHCRFSTLSELDRTPGGFVPFEQNERARQMVEQLFRQFTGFSGAMPISIPGRSELLRLAMQVVGPTEGPFERALFPDLKSQLISLVKRWPGKLVLKRERGASGHGFAFTESGEMPQDLTPFSVVETWVDRLADVSCLFDVCADGKIRHTGFTRFFTSNGLYRGTAIGPALPGRDFSRLMGRMEELATRIGPLLAASGYQGPAGIDGYLYAHRGEIFVQPCSEINLRFTFGHLSLRLQRIRSGPGLFWILPARRALELYRTKPTGVLFLTDPLLARRFAAVLLEGGPLPELFDRALQLESPAGAEKSWRQSATDSKLSLWLPSGR
ncbi:MAG: DUF455 family protein [Spirochaetales bacterium]|nr:DUF455 family protein [Spirochaetales bacterium]